MTCIVQKYGGSSVADVDQLRKIVRMIADLKVRNTDIAVVVSAMGKTTDELVAMAREISPKPPRREMDMLLSTGERITMAMLCMALNEQGIDAVSLTGSQAGIITNDRHNDAQVIEVRPFRVQDEMAKGKVVIIGGFQGVSYKRDITTLGRGGSDTTAVALAAALGAERCEIYSDVDGVYSTDPSMVDDAIHLPEVSYPVMQEMSMAGAKVLHASAVQFAKEKNIAIYARSTFSPGRETIIRRLSPGRLSASAYTVPTFMPASNKPWIFWKASRYRSKKSMLPRSPLTANNQPHPLLFPRKISTDGSRSNPHCRTNWGKISNLTPAWQPFR